MSALDVGAGLARGLATVLAGHRQDESRKALDKQHQQDAVRLAMYNKGREEGQDHDTMVGVLGMEDYFTGGKKPAKGEPDFNAILSMIPTGAPAQGVDAAAMQAGGPPTTAAPRMLTSDELAAQKATQGAQALVTKQTLLAKAAQAYLPQLQALDPTATIKDALDFMSGKDLFKVPGGAAFQSIPGEMPNGAPAFGVFDRATGSYVDPTTHQPLVGFQPRTTTGSRSMGADRESLAKEMFGIQASRLDKDQMAAVNARMATFAEQQSKARGLGSGKAKTETELNAPIGPTAAVQYNVSPTTTLKQLSETMGLTTAQQDKIASHAQVDQLLSEIADGIEKVFPSVAPGVKGRLQTQFTLGMKRLAADEDLAGLDSAINGALAQVVQLQGQPGSRISDKDIELAKATLAELKPSVFGGDTLATAKVRLGVLRRLFDKAEQGVVVPRPKVTAPESSGSSRPAGNKPVDGATIRDGKLYINGQLIQ